MIMRLLWQNQAIIVVRTANMSTCFHQCSQTPGEAAERYITMQNPCASAEEHCMIIVSQQDGGEGAITPGNKAVEPVRQWNCTLVSKALMLGAMISCAHSFSACELLMKRPSQNDQPITFIYYIYLFILVYVDVCCITAYVAPHNTFLVLGYFPLLVSSRIVHEVWTLPQGQHVVSKSSHFNTLS